MPTWIRVRDDTTGAHYDVEERSLRPGMTPIPGYPKLSGPDAQPRPTKYPRDLGPADRDTAPTDPAPPADPEE